MNYEDILVEKYSEDFIRRKFYLMGMRYPTEQAVSLIKRQLIARLVAKYGKIERIRSHMKSNSYDEIFEQNIEGLL